MTSKLAQETPSERRAAIAIRAGVEAQIALRGWSTNVLAEKLGLLPEGVETLRAKHWNLEKAWRIADALGVHLEIVVRP